MRGLINKEKLNDVYGCENELQIDIVMFSFKKRLLQKTQQLLSENYHPYTLLVSFGGYKTNLFISYYLNKFLDMKMYSTKKDLWKRPLSLMERQLIL